MWNFHFYVFGVCFSMLKRPEGETCSNKFHLKYNKRLFKITIKSKTTLIHFFRLAIFAEMLWFWWVWEHVFTEWCFLVKYCVLKVTRITRLDNLCSSRSDPNSAQVSTIQIYIKKTFQFEILLFRNSSIYLSFSSVLVILLDWWW